MSRKEGSGGYIVPVDIHKQPLRWAEEPVTVDRDIPFGHVPLAYTASGVLNRGLADQVAGVLIDVG